MISVGNSAKATTPEDESANANSMTNGTTAKSVLTANSTTNGTTAKPTPTANTTTKPTPAKSTTTPPGPYGDFSLKENGTYCILAQLFAEFSITFAVNNSSRNEV